MVYEYLRQNYEPGEPIFLTDVAIDGMTEPNVRYHIKRLTDDGQLCRFDSGVYYLPKRGVLGGEVAMSPETVAMHKYIRRRGRRIGYFSGRTLANRLGLSTQVPTTAEITSNLAPAAVRKVAIKGKNYLLRRPMVDVTDDNAAVLQFLDCLKDIEETSDLDASRSGEILTRYAAEHGITREQVDDLIPRCSLKVYKAIYTTRVSYVSA